MTFASKLALIGSLASTALAHGTVTGFVTDGTYNGGFLLDYYYMIQNGQTPPDTAGWYAENLDNGFVEPNNFGTADIICHVAAKPATSSATVAAGGSVEFQWSEWPDSHMGPVLTYVANCGGDCAEADKEALQWVKIDEAGYDAEAQEWAAITMIANNNTWVSTVPETLAPGNYVFRHEIIALHGAGEANGAQAYPQCVNIEITGSGTDEPEGVAGTELYTAEDPGILFSPYNGDLENYVIPGPALYGSGSEPPTPGQPQPPVNSTIPIPTQSAVPTGTGIFPPIPTATGIPTEPSVPGPSSIAEPSNPPQPTGGPEFPTFPEIPTGESSAAPEPTTAPEEPEQPEQPEEPTVSDSPSAPAESSAAPQPSAGPEDPEPEEPEVPEPEEPEVPSPEDPTNPPDGGFFPSLPEPFTLEAFIQWLTKIAERMKSRGGSQSRRHPREILV